jgi:hypothetical protein
LSRNYALLQRASLALLGVGVATIAQNVPNEDWERVPKDFAEHLDHYLYGTSKTTPGSASSRIQVKRYAC